MPKVSRRGIQDPSFHDILKDALAGTAYNTYAAFDDEGYYTFIARKDQAHRDKAVAIYCGLQEGVYLITIWDEQSFEVLKAAAERIEEKYPIAIEISLP